MKTIQCPEHPQHQATLYEWPEKFAGIWECDFEGENYSDSCEHDPERWEIEDAVEDYYDPGDSHGHGQREYRIYVCGDCGCAIEDADPAEDAHDAMVDAEIDEARDRED